MELGLIQPRQMADGLQAEKVMAFVDDYIAKRTDVKPGTQLNYGKMRKYLAKYFGTDRGLPSVTQLDAEQFRAWLINEGLQENTVRSHCIFAKLFFGAAVKGERIKKNLFCGIKTQLPAKGVSRGIVVWRRR